MRQHITAEQCRVEQKRVYYIVMQGRVGLSRIQPSTVQYSTAERSTVYYSRVAQSRTQQSKVENSLTFLYSFALFSFHFTAVTWIYAVLSIQISVCIFRFFIPRFISTFSSLICILSSFSSFFFLLFFSILNFFIRDGLALHCTTSFLFPYIFNLILLISQLYP